MKSEGKLYTSLSLDSVVFFGVLEVVVPVDVSEWDTWCIENSFNFAWEANPELCWSQTIFTNAIDDSAFKGARVFAMERLFYKTNCVSANFSFKGDFLTFPFLVCRLNVHAVTNDWNTTHTFHLFLLRWKYVNWYN